MRLTGLALIMAIAMPGLGLAQAPSIAKDAASPPASLTPDAASPIPQDALPPAELPAASATTVDSSIASPPVTPEANAGVTELPGVEVDRKRDALSKSDAKLKALIATLPCNGCDVKKKIEAKKSFTEKALTFAVKECCIPTAPPPTDEATSVAHDVSDAERHPPNLNP